MASHHHAAIKDLEIAKLKEENEILKSENLRLNMLCKKEKKARMEAEERLKQFKIDHDFVIDTDDIVIDDVIVVDDIDSDVDDIDVDDVVIIDGDVDGGSSMTSTSNYPSMDTASTIRYGSSIGESNSQDVDDDVDDGGDSSSMVATTVRYDIESSIGEDDSQDIEKLKSEMAQKHEENETLKQKLIQSKVNQRESIVKRSPKPEHPYIPKEHINAEQMSQLLHVLTKTRNPTPKIYHQLADDTGLGLMKIKHWFTGINKKARDLMDKAANESTKLRELMELDKLKHDDVERIFYE